MTGSQPGVNAICIAHSSEEKKFAQQGERSHHIQSQEGSGLQERVLIPAVNAKAHGSDVTIHIMYPDTDHMFTKCKQGLKVLFIFRKTMLGDGQ